MRIARFTFCTLVALAATAAITTAGAQVPAAADVAAPPASSPSNFSVRFRDREIDLRRHLEGFPFIRFKAEYDANRLVYFHDTRTTRELWTLPLDGASLDPATGTRLGDVNWNTRNFRSIRWDPAHREYIVLADDANEERYNLFALSQESGAIRRLTDRPYIYGYDLDKANRIVGYVPRYPGNGRPYRSCVNLFDVTSGTDREVICDTAEQTFTWTEVNFRPSGTGLVITALRASDRNHQTLLHVDLSVATPIVTTLLDNTVRRRNVSTMHDWLDENHFVYTSDESGFTNVYVYDLAAARTRQLTSFTEDVEDVVPLVVNARTVLAVMVKRPYESELFVVDPVSAAVLARRVFDATVTFLDHTGNRALARSVSRRSQFALDEITVTLPTPASAAITIASRARMPEAVARGIERCDAERVAIPTFDMDPRTGRTRTLHAYLQTPRAAPATSRQRFALIESFYGGDNDFDTTAQIVCDAGGIVLSTSVRGSSGFGAEFAALNDHDLGGNEVVDLMYAGRYLTRRFGLAERQIGLYGGSHGGYEVMRALTMPDEINGRRERFDWGFGVAWFGFSNIVTFFETCNIPDWVLLEAGNPQTERQRLLDRSPVTNAARSSAPMLLLHGENDNRVPVRESRQMAAALRAAHRPVTYIEFPGQGHGLKGLGNQLRVWSEVFAFLERETAHPASAAVAASALDTRRRRGRSRLLGAVSVALLLIAGAGAYRASRRRADRTN